MLSIKLADLAQQLNAELYGDGEIIITRVASMVSAKEGEITFLADSKFREKLINCQASAVILAKDDLPYCHCAALVVNHPYLSYAQVAQIMDTTPLPAKGISAAAYISPLAKLGNNVAIGPHAVIEDHVSIGDNSAIGAGSFIGKGTQLGKNSRIWANVTVYHDVLIGDNCLIHANTVIGADGFGYANAKGKWIKIPQLGSVVIGDHVEIGSCTTIDRGALDNTIIGNGVIIDNHCQIAHNVVIGDYTAIAGGVVMGGSLTIGKYCQIGGASVLKGHMEICDKVVITGMGMVMRPIDKPGIYSSGIPLQPNKTWRKTAALVLHIDEMNKRLKALERELKQIQDKVC